MSNLENLELQRLVDYNETICKSLLLKVRYPWEAVQEIRNYLTELIRNLPEGYTEIQKDVWVAENTVIEPSVMIKGPAIIGRNCELRHGAYIRDNVIIGDGVTVGNSTEIKNAILFNGAQIPHYNYVGDSILGYKAHMGAGAIISNFKAIKGTVKVRYSDSSYVDTGLRKFGAVLGDHAEVGCNCVLNPGSIVGKNSVIYPLTSLRGVVAENSIVKGNGIVIAKTEN